MIRYAEHSIHPSDVEAVLSALQNPNLTGGELVEDFERAIAQRTFGTSSDTGAAAVNSGTAALTCAYLASGLKPGDEVIVPEITFAATATAAMHLGATVVPCDVDPITGLIDVEDALRRVTRKTRIVVPVHLNGQKAPVTRLVKDLPRGGVRVVEDAAHAMGQQGIAEFSDSAIYSFHPAKHITTGEGGAVVSSNPERIAHVKLARNHANAGTGRASFPAWNFRMPALNAALGRSQLRRLNDNIGTRCRLVTFYDSAVSAMSNGRISILGASATWNVHHVCVAQSERWFDVAEKETVVQRMAENGIQTRVLYQPISKVLGLGVPRSNAMRYAQRSLAIPLHLRLTSADIMKIVEVLCAY